MSTTSKTQRDKKNPNQDQQSAADLFNALFEDPPLLDNEDPDLYRQLMDFVTAETGAKSFLGRVAANDYVEKLFEERRSKAAITDVIRGARARAASFAEDDQQEMEAIEKCLPLWLKLDRMVNNSQASRRAFLKELRQMASDDTPPLASKPAEEA
jgi:GTP1/Obg family GTP-binding protein